MGGKLKERCHHSGKKVEEKLNEKQQQESIQTWKKLGYVCVW